MSVVMNTLQKSLSFRSRGNKMKNLEENICAETHDWIMDSSQGGNVLLTQECFIH